MSDKPGNGINPPAHEFRAPEIVRLFLRRFRGENVADFYQIRPCDSERIEGFDLVTGEALAWMVLQCCRHHISAQAQTALCGELTKLFEFISGAAEGVDFRRCFPLGILFHFVLIMWLRSASLRVARETFRSAKPGQGFCNTKGFLEKYRQKAGALTIKIPGRD